MTSRKEHTMRRIAVIAVMVIFLFSGNPATSSTPTCQEWTIVPERGARFLLRFREDWKVHRSGYHKNGDDLLMRYPSGRVAARFYDVAHVIFGPGGIPCP